MSSTASTRRARASDADAIKSLIDLYVPSGTLLPRTHSFIINHIHDFIVAENDAGDIVGCVHLDEYAPSLAEIRSLAVAPGRQGGGVGNSLVAEAERLARKRDLTTLFAVSNTGAFFERLGYAAREIPELDRERSAVSRFKGVYAKDLR